MKTTKKTLAMSLALTASMAAGCANSATPPAPPAQAAPQVLADGAAARHQRTDNMHQTRFIEIFLTGREDGTGKLVAACYNSMYTSKGIPASRDTAPQELVEGLDLEKIKEEYGVLNASLNGPKLWLPDWCEIDMGVERNFNKISAAWVAQLNMGDNARGVEKTAPYEPMTIARKSALGWNKGTRVMLLDDAAGNTWIMKGFQLGLKPRYAYDEFLAAGQTAYQNLPPGWKVRVTVLEKDLVETPEGAVATIMADEHFNIWDKTGPGMSNYKP